MILTVVLSPSIDVTIELDNLEVGKTNHAKSKRYRAAGKALNVAKDLCAMGANVMVTGFMYSENMATFTDMLSAQGIEYSFVENPGRVRENYKFIDKKSMLTEVNFVGAEILPTSEEELIKRVSVLSKNCSVVVLSGGAPKGLNDDYYGKLLNAVSPSCLRIADATAGKLLSAIKSGADLIKPNIQELENVLGMEIHSKEEGLRGCQELIKMGAKKVLLSMGRQGAVITDGKQSFYCKSNQVAVNSTVGAGDAMVAAAAIALETKAPIEEILRAGVAAGTAAVTTFDESLFPYSRYKEIYSSLQVIKL